ncbi:MAG: 4,5-DOPA dioxygenase extradiol [Bacteroidales bacterium]
MKKPAGPGSDAPMPLLFLGHGSPMNAIEDNAFTRSFRALGQELPRPEAILVISAHWETRGTRITALDRPPTIHDFGGFPEALYQIQYPAPGAPKLATEVQNLVKPTPVEGDLAWGLDHGAWTVLRHLYPNADIPVLQLSLDTTKGPADHYALGKQLAALRNQGILIVASGNLIHNLGRVAWNKLDGPFAHDWAREAREFINRAIREGRHDDLIRYRQQGTAMQLAAPTPEHFLPLLYVLALQTSHEEVRFFNDETVGGSLSMTSLAIGDQPWQLTG